MRILAVEDDPGVLATLRGGFEAEGHQIVTVETGEEGEARARAEDFDLLIVDIGLPGMSGLELVKRLRESGDERPVIFLTAERSEADIVRGLELGADGYVPKPFSLNELKARARALLRTVERLNKKTVSFGGLELDRLNRAVKRHGKTVSLTEVEMKILTALLGRRGDPISRQELLDEVWGIRFDPGTANLDVHLHNLRKKLRAVGPPLIENVRSRGWRIKEE